MLRKLLISACVFLILYEAGTGLSGCAKEYSYEGGDIVSTLPDTVVIPDSTIIPGTGLPYCQGCHGINNPMGLFWNFKFDTSLLCGNVTNAVITPERNAFTFFGPSTCSLDTGLVMTVFLDTANALDRDKYNIVTNNVALEYYDNTTHTDIFISRRPSMSFAIDSYDHSTGIVKGTFNGYVKMKDSTQKQVMNGQFVIQFK